MVVVWGGAGGTGGGSGAAANPPGVTAPPYEILLDQNGTYNFTQATIGYGPISPKTITNTGTENTGPSLPPWPLILLRFR